MRYAVVGGVAFVIDLGLLLLLSQLVPLVLANTIAFLVANAANFLIGHRWVFGSAGRDSDILAKYRAVLLISLAGVALNDAFVWIGVGLLHASVVMSKIAATLAVWGWNYWARVLWVYGRD
jgi:putative flippase GtrA